MSADRPVRSCEAGRAKRLRRARHLPPWFGVDDAAGGLAVDPGEVRVEPGAPMGEDQRVLARAPVDEAPGSSRMIRKWSGDAIVEVHVAVSAPAGLAGPFSASMVDPPRVRG